MTMPRLSLAFNLSHNITHYPVPRTFSDMEIIRPSSQVSHVERHVESFSQMIQIYRSEAEKVIAAEPTNGCHIALSLTLNHSNLTRPTACCSAERESRKQVRRPERGRERLEKII
uniref:Uncharacterized protein n=2 Tax=Opuntia streptacantha TaxID=393608 RepID=A0A7C8YSD5_OPUST